MITPTSAATTVNAAESFVSEIASLASTVSSFADQLATAVGQMAGRTQSGSQLDVDFSAPPHQNPDTQRLSSPVPSTPAPSALYAGSSRDSAATTDVFIEDFLRAAAASTPSAPSGATAPSTNTPDVPDVRGSGWLSPPYYVPPPPVYVSVPQPLPFPSTNYPTAETMLQVTAAEYLNDPACFMSGAASVTSPQELTSSMIAYAQQLSQYSWSSFTCAGFDPVALGTKYANVILDTLKQIPAAPWNQSATGSVYDAWVGGVPVNIYAPPPSTAPSLSNT
jgi:hypothetical protein